LWRNNGGWHVAAEEEKPAPDWSMFISTLARKKGSVTVSEKVQAGAHFWHKTGCVSIHFQDTKLGHTET
jgi:hypothetical protein